MRVFGGSAVMRLIVACTAVACVGPLFSLVVLAISLHWPYPELFPSVLSFYFVVDVLTSPALLLSTIHSLVIALLVTILTLVLTIPAAKAVGLYHFKGRDTVMLLALLPIMVPTATVSMGLHYAMIRVGLAGTVLGVVIVHTVFTIPYAFRVLTHVFELVGDRHEQQALMLGASPFGVFTAVTLPLVMPGVLSAATMSFIVSFSQYITTFVIGGGRIITLPLHLVPHVQGGELHIVSVYSLVFILITLSALMLIQGFVRRYYREAFFLYP